LYSPVELTCNELNEEPSDHVKVPDGIGLGLNVTELPLHNAVSFPSVKRLGALSVVMITESLVMPH
jgi:hypothetical protein